jgi:hypothetical protein
VNAANYLTVGASIVTSCRATVTHGCAGKKMLSRAHTHLAVSVGPIQSQGTAAEIFGQERDREHSMLSAKQRRIAIETFIK